jgi:caffeoyl-CoA O-methyltransferase
MKEIINPLAEIYAARFTTPTDALLQEIESYTYAHHPESQMLSGPVQGKMLELFSCMIRPERILEVGTFMGYSALCLVKGLGSTGRLHTLELRSEDAARAQGYFSKSLYSDRIISHVGNALNIITELKENWDLVFIDADKVNYINYYELTLPQLKKGGFILADNVLFHGEVLEDPISGKNAMAIDAFNRHVKEDPRVHHMLMTVRDGVMLIQKK